MSEWNFDMSAAPRGEYVEEEVWSGKSKEMRTVRKYVAPRVILSSKCDKVITSRWMPPDDGEKRPVGRWEFFSVDSEPLAWQAYPEHPMEADDGS